MSNRWWARGLLFENCNCQLICPGHVHFDQLCTNDPCVGYWAIVFREGEFEGTDLGGTSAVIAYESPQRMIDGGWVQVILIDDAADEAQRTAIETILTGQAGGPWETLARFVAERLPTCFMPIRIDEDGRKKSVTIDGLLETTVEPIRGRDRGEPVTFENIFNQIHASTQVIARGATRYDDGRIVIATEGTHGLYSDFEWAVPH